MDKTPAVLTGVLYIAGCWKSASFVKVTDDLYMFADSGTPRDISDFFLGEKSGVFKRNATVI